MGRSDEKVVVVSVQKKHGISGKKPQNPPPTFRAEVKDKDIDITTYTKRLKRLFLYYADFGERINSKAIKLSLLMKLLREARILDEGRLSTTAVELMFKAVGGVTSRLDFEKFQYFLIKVANQKYGNLGENTLGKEREVLLRLLHEHIFPLYQQVFHSHQWSKEEEALNTPVDPKCFAILGRVLDNLTIIYKAYFGEEFRDLRTKFTDEAYEKKLIHRCETTSGLALTQLLKDFDVFPQLLSLNICNFLFNELMDDDRVQSGAAFEGIQNLPPTMGRRFTLYSFFMLMIRTAIFGYSSVFNPAMAAYDHLHQGEKLLLLFNRMDQSIGVEKLGTLVQSTRSYKWHLAQPDSFIKKLYPHSRVISTFDLGREEARLLREDLKSPQFHEHETPEMGGAGNGRFTQREEFGTPSKYNGRELFGYMSEKKKEQAIKDYIDVLLEVFQKYCLIHQNSLDAMHNITLHKFFYEAGVTQFSTDPDVSTNHALLSRLELDLIIIAALQGRKEHFPFGEDHMPIYTTYTSLDIKKPNGKPKKFTFETFVKIIELIAKKVWPNELASQSIPKLIQQYLLPIKEHLQQRLPRPATPPRFGTNDSAHHSPFKTPRMETLGTHRDDHLDTMMSVFKDETMRPLLALAANALEPYFIEYADERKGTEAWMTYNALQGFCNDFRIVPEVVKVQKLKRCFELIYTIHHPPRSLLSAGRHNTEESSGGIGNGQMTINHEQFMEMIVLFALEQVTPFEERTPNEAVINKLSYSSLEIVCR